MTTCATCATPFPAGASCPRCTTSAFAPLEQSSAFAPREQPAAAHASSLPPPPPGHLATAAPPPPPFATQASYPPQNAYPPQPAYPQQNAYPPQPAYPQQNAYPQQSYAPPPPWGGQWQGYGYQPAAPTRTGKSTTGIVLGVIGLFILPIILCPIGIVLGVQAKKKGDPRGQTAIIVSSVCLVAGMVLGVLVQSALKTT